MGSNDENLDVVVKANEALTSGMAPNTTRKPTIDLGA